MQSHACKDNNRTQRGSIGQRVAMEGHRMQWKHANEGERIERTISIDGNTVTQKTVPMFRVFCLNSEFLHNTML